MRELLFIFLGSVKIVVMKENVRIFRRCRLKVLGLIPATYSGAHTHTHTHTNMHTHTV